MVFMAVSKLLMVLGAGWITCEVSKRSPNTVIATLHFLAALLIPVGAAWLLLVQNFIDKR